MAAGLEHKLKDIIIWDLDGTLACGKHRLHLLPKEDYHLTKSWEKFNLACFDDAPIQDNIQLMQSMHGAGYITVILTGRSAIARELTEDWLDKHGIQYDHMKMREEDDNRKDTVIKEEFLRNLGLKRVLCCFDDLPQVASHLRDIGLTCHLVTEYTNDRVDLKSHGVDK